MSVNDLFNILNIDTSKQTSNFASKNVSKETGYSFLNVLSSANKAVNYSYEKEYSSYNNKNDFSRKNEFKSDYESFSNTFDKKEQDYAKSNETFAYEKNYEVNREQENQAQKPAEKRAEHQKQTKESHNIEETNKKPADNHDKSLEENKKIKREKSEEKQEVNEETAKSLEKKGVKERKQETADAENSEPKAIISNSQTNILVLDKAEGLKAHFNTNNDKKQDGKTTENTLVKVQIKDESGVKVALKLHEGTKNGEGLSEDAGAKVLKDAKNHIKSEENVAEKKGEISLEGLEKTEEAKLSSEEADLVKKLKPENNTKPNINSEEIKKLAQKEAKEVKQQILQEGTDKPEIKAFENDVETLNHLENGKTNPGSQKLPEGFQKENAKPVAAPVETNNASPKKDFSDLSGGNNRNNQQELKGNSSSAPQIMADSISVKGESIRNTQFERILNTKTSNSLEQSVLEQVNKKITSDVANNKSQVNIILRPENLGRVNLNISSQNGVLTAQITAESPQVKDMLNKGLETLRQNLADQGVNVGKLVVNVQEPSSSNNNNSAEHNFQKFNGNNSGGTGFNQGHQGKQNENSPNGQSLGRFDYQEGKEFLNETVNGDNLKQENTAASSGTVDYRV